MISRIGFEHPISFLPLSFLIERSLQWLDQLSVSHIFESVDLGFGASKGTKWNPTTSKFGAIQTLAPRTVSAAEYYIAGKLEAKVGITYEEVEVLSWKGLFSLLKFIDWYMWEFLGIEF